MKQELSRLGVSLTSQACLIVVIEFIQYHIELAVMNAILKVTIQPHTRRRITRPVANSHMMRSVSSINHEYKPVQLMLANMPVAARHVQGRCGNYAANGRATTFA